MGAKLLKYHCENADSPIYKNLMSQPSVLAVGSGCTGTASLLSSTLVFMIYVVKAVKVTTKPNSFCRTKPPGRVDLSLLEVWGVCGHCSWDVGQSLLWPRQLWDMAASKTRSKSKWLMTWLWQLLVVRNCRVIDMSLWCCLYCHWVWVIVVVIAIVNVVVLFLIAEEVEVRFGCESVEFKRDYAMQRTRDRGQGCMFKDTW